MLKRRAGGWAGGNVQRGEFTLPFSGARPCPVLRLGLECWPGEAVPVMFAASEEVSEGGVNCV